MYLKIQTSELSSGNTGSCKQLVDYLCKEDNLAIEEGKKASFFFANGKDLVFRDEVIKAIDENGRGGLRKDEAKFYSIVLAPSERELEHIANDTNKLREYARDVMQAYAENFKKGLNSDDLVWYGKIEHKRYYKGFDVIPKGFKQGDEKEGLHTHVHIIVSRKTKQGKKISPLANQRGTEITTGTGKKVVAGFDRDVFKIKSEQIFDVKFNYKRSSAERYKGIERQEFDTSVYKSQIEQIARYNRYNSEEEQNKNKSKIKN